VDVSVPTNSGTVTIRNEQEVIAMAKTLKVANHLLTWHGALMLCLGMALSTLGSVMVNPTHTESGYAIAAVISAVCLLVAGVYLGVVEARSRLRRSAAMYLLIGVPPIACWLMFWLFQSATSDIRLLGLIAGMHGLFWGLWYLRLAFRFQTYPIKAVVLCALGAITTCIGIILATQADLSQLGAVTAVAVYMTFIGIQILMTAVFLHRECEAEKEFAGWQQREIEMDSTRLETPRRSITAPAGDD
jgi:hypothetical protein